MEHHHHHHHHHSTMKNLKLGFWLNLIFSIIEILGGLYVNSVAIVSDAIHDLGDSLSMGTAWYLEKTSKKEADDKYTFGYRRYSLLGALINSIVIITGSILVLYEVVQRLLHPELSDALGMVFFAIIGLAVNGWVALRMRHTSSMNEKVAFWHTLEDVLGWAGVLLAALVMLIYPNPYIDPVLSIIITGFILVGVVKRLKETLYFFLQGIPKDINLNAIKQKIVELPHVHSLHHTHVWSLDGENHVFTTHACLKNIDSFQQITATKNAIKNILKENKFQHFTVETELNNELCTFR